MAENEIDVYSEILLSNNIRASGSEYEQSWDGKKSKINMPTSIFDDVVDTAGDVAETVGDFATGVVKGLPQGASKAGTEIMDTFTGQWFSETAIPWMNENIPGLDSANKAINETIKYDGTAQQIGGIVGEVGTQIIAPGALATKGIQGVNVGSRFLTNVLGYGATEALVIPAKDKGLIETAITLISKDSEATKALLETLEADKDLPYLMQKLQRSPLLLLEGGVIGEGISEGLGLLLKYGKNSPMLRSLKSGVKSQFQKIGEKAQRELDQDTGGTTLSSMGAGEMNTALNTHLAKLAKNREQATRKVDELGFYSKALEETNKFKQEKGTGQQFKSMLLKAGVKQDEIDWSGLDEVLSKDKITKQEIIDQLEANRIELEEVEKVGSFEEGYFDLTDSFNGERLDDEAIKKGVIPDKMKSTFTIEEAYGDDYLANRASELKDDDPSLSDELAMQQAKDEYYDDPIRFYIDEKTGYTITGNSEVGYSIFKSKDESFNHQNRLKSLNSDEPIYSINEAEIQAEQLARDSGDIQGPLDELDAGKYESYTLPGGENYREILTTYGRQGLIQNKKMRETGEYNGPHFDEENIIAHFRTKDRMYGDKKVLYIEEIQSDWGQQGRRQGFTLEPNQKVEFLKKADEIKLELEKEINEYTIKKDGKQIPYADYYFKLVKRENRDFRNDPNLKDSDKRYMELSQLDELQKLFYEEASNGLLFKNGVNVLQKDGATKANPFVTEGQIAQKYNQLTSAVNKVYGPKLPKAPFVTDTNKWTALAIKRIISKASEEGYDAVAITPGKVHANRWNTPGLADFYDNVVPKISKQVVGKLDGNVKKLPSSKDTDLRDTPSGDEYYNMEAFDGALFIDLTPQVKDKAKKGQALFAVPVGATAVGVSQQENNGATDG